MIKPRWEADFPADVRALVEPHLTRWLPLLPTWCQHFLVRYSGTIDCTAQVEISHRNRWALLSISGTWVQYEEDEREQAIIHELIHVALEPLYMATRNVVEDLTNDGTPLRSLAQSMTMDGLECSTDDLARSIQRLVQRIEGPNVSKPIIRRVERESAA